MQCQVINGSVNFGPSSLGGPKSRGGRAIKGNSEGYGHLLKTCRADLEIFKITGANHKAQIVKEAHLRFRFGCLDLEGIKSKCHRTAYIRDTVVRSTLPGRSILPAN